MNVLKEKKKRKLRGKDEKLRILPKNQSVALLVMFGFIRSWGKILMNFKYVKLDRWIDKN